MNATDAMLGFSAFPGIGPIRFKLLVEYFGSVERAWLASDPEFRSVGLPDKIRISFLAFRSTFSADQYRHTLSRFHIVPICQTDQRYPVTLREISDPPIVLYVRGKRGNQEPIDFSRAVAIVGTRKPTPYGKEMTTRIVSGLVRAGCSIISGMALGVDAVAHETAIAEHGQTVAVLGCGVDIIAPATNTHIYRSLTDGGSGAVVSEIPPGIRPDKRFFPVRNRIVSGLSRAVVVIEGAKDSGTLITARYAADQGKDVFAVPGEALSPMSEAPNTLIKNGAGIATSAADILQALGIHDIPSKCRAIPVFSSTDEQIIHDALVRNGPHNPDELAHMTGLAVPSVLTVCTVLELSHLIKNIGNSVYAAVDESV